MKNQLLLAAAMVCLGVTGAVRAGDVSVGVSIAVDQPGLYGRIDIGNAPPPQVIYARPVVVLPPPPTVTREAEPLYLHVPPGHARNWRKHCREYDACGRPVYFVKDRWYNEVYVPARRQYHERGDRRDEHPAEGRDERHDDRHGHGQGRGHGEGHDRGEDRDH